MASHYLRARHPLTAAFRPLKCSRGPTFRPRLANRASQRPASTTSTGSTDSMFVSRLRIFAFGTSIAASAYLVYLYATDTRASIHQWLVPPLIRVIYPDAEDAHHAGTTALSVLYSLGLHPRERSPTGQPADQLSTSVYDAALPNPVGISAGLDKDADIPDALFDLGAAVVEVGGCTARPQPGNDRPRVFRVPVLDGLINRYGLNSRGANAVAARLRARVREFAHRMGVSERDVLDGRVELADGGGVVQPGSLRPGGLLAVQIAKNKDTDEKDVDAVIGDYVYCVNRLAPYADVLVVNVSSPNTPGLRDLQATEPLTRLLSAVVDEARRTDRRLKPRVMVKVSPDEDDETQMEGVVQAVWMSGVDGVIVGNTTKRRTGLVPPTLRLSVKEQQALREDGGFSGPAMFDRTLDLVKRYRKMLDGHSFQQESAPDSAVEPVQAEDGAVAGKAKKLVGDGSEQKVIFATGGITNGRQALEVLNAGASVAMVYTALVYGGSGTVTRIKREMRDGLQS